MKKRLFQVLDEMNINDGNNKTATCACCFDFVSAKTANGGGHITMGVPTEAIMKIMNNEYKPMLILLDYKEYKRIEAIPLDDKLEAATSRAERYEKALCLIEQMSDPGDYYKAICDMKAIATEALASKPTTNEPNT